MLKYTLPLAIIPLLGVPALATPNDPPACDPASPQFQSSVEGSVLIAVPAEDVAYRQVITLGCLAAHAEVSPDHANPPTCITIATSDLREAIQVLESQDIKLEAFVGPLTGLSTEDISAIMQRVSGRVIFDDPALPEERSIVGEFSTQIATDDLTKYGFSSFLRAHGD